MTSLSSCSILVIWSAERTIQSLQLRNPGHVAAPQRTEEEVLLFKMSRCTVSTTVLLSWMIDRVVSISAPSLLFKGRAVFLSTEILQRRSRSLVRHPRPAGVMGRSRAGANFT